MLRRSFAVGEGLLASIGGLAQPPVKGIAFRVKLDPKVVGAKPESGRVLIGIARARQRPNFTSYRPPVLPILLRGCPRLRSGHDRHARQSLHDVPIREAQCPPGRGVFGPGDLCDQPRHQPAGRAGQPLLRSSHRETRPGRRHNHRSHAEQGLQGTRAERRRATHKYLKLTSKLLSDFHGRPMEFRVGVVLPPDFDREPDKQYGLIVDIGGFGTRYTSAAFHRPDPRFVQIVPDGAGPSATRTRWTRRTTAPTATALTQEVIPYIEKTYRCLGTPQ